MPSTMRETIKKVTSWLVEPSTSLRDPLDIQRAQLSATFSLVALVITVSWAIAAFASTAPVWIPTWISLQALALTLAYIFSRSVNYRAGIGWLVGCLLIWGFVYPLFDLSLAPLTLLLLVGSALLIGSVLLPTRTAVLLLVGVVVVSFLLPTSNVVERSVISSLAIGLLFVGALAIGISAFRNRTEWQQALELQDLRDNLNKRVEERTYQIRTAVEIGQVIATAATMEELLRMVSNLIPARLGLYTARLFLPDEGGRNMVLRFPQSGEEITRERPLRVAVGSSSIIGWVAQNRLLRTFSMAQEDPLGLQSALAKGSQSQVVIPLLVKDVLVGILDVQSEQADAFDEWDVVATLQTLANQTAVAIQNVRRFQTAQFNVEDVSELYRSSYPVTQVQVEEEIVLAVKNTFSRGPYLSLYMVVEEDGLRMAASFDPQGQEENPLPDKIGTPLRELEGYLAAGWFVADGPRLGTLPYELVRLIRQLRLFSVALVPVRLGDEIQAIMLVGTRENRPLSTAAIQPYGTLAELIVNALERIQEKHKTQRRLAEMEVLVNASREISGISEIESLYRKVHDYVRRALGDVNFQFVRYDASTNTLNIPYLFDKGREGGEIASVEAFPAGEGLTSLVVRTKQALSLADQVKERAEALGVRIVDEKPVESWEWVVLSRVSPSSVPQLASRLPKSWLGVPMLVGETVLGAIVVQHMERENAFDQDDLEFLQTLAAQAGGLLYNQQLLEETHRRAVQLQTAAEIAREISLSLDVDEVLSKAVNLIRERFNFYHAAVFLVDPANEYAVIREATGEAGQQMKRSGHRLKIGSASIVGYVTSSGEPLVVNDTARDATYYPNPLLPDTRAETAVPLKVGTRILGALDVQSTRPYSFTEDALEVLRILADQLAVAVLNSELFADTQEHLSQHRLLHHVTTAAASGTTLREALAGAAQGLQVTLGGDRVTILLADAQRKVLRVRAYAGYSEEITQLEIPFGQGITGWVAEHQQLLRVNDVTQEPRYLEVSSDVRSELAIPLVYRGELLGVLNVESDQLGAYDESDEEMLGTLAGSLAAIIANARLLDQVRRQVDRERLIYELTTRIRRATNMQSVMATTATELSRVLGARRARIKINPMGQSEAANDGQKGHSAEGWR